MRKHVFAAAAVACLVFGASLSAIRYGTPDGDGHPFVGLMVAKDAAGNPLWRCSGTLLSPTVFLTAGHCTESPAVSAEIWFESQVFRGDPATGYPFEGPTSVSGTTHTHPQYNPGAFFLYDLGVVTLDTPVARSAYGALPIVGTLDGLATRRGLKNTTITAVGYGLQQTRPNPAGPNFTLSDLWREVAETRLISVNGTTGIPGGTSVILSDNANTGGTCFGDSGGPLFYGSSNTVVAVTSFGINQNCAGIGGGYRVDMPDDLAWVESFLQ